MPRIKRFIECLIPVTACNLHCSYCYIVQENRRDGKFPEFRYDVRTITTALSEKRLGGCSYISICGAGETLIPKEIVEITQSLLAEGHYVNLTTNGTQTERFNELIDISKEQSSRLHFAFSFHYLELKKNHLLKVFFENIKRVRKAGCSFVLQMNMSDEYIPYIDKIIKLCVREVGAPPQLAITRTSGSLPTKLFTKLSAEKYYKLGTKFKSPLFDFTFKNFQVKRNEYCYAGKWSGVLNLATGELRRCYSDSFPQNIFEDTSKPIEFKAMGKECMCSYCINSSHFMSLGVIPFLKTPSYADLRDRPEAEWYSPKMKKFLSGKLIKSNFNLSLLSDLLKQFSVYMKEHLI